MKKELVVLALAAMAATASLTGCAHFAMRGSVVEVEGADEAQVCLGNHEVKAGDRVALFKIVCSGPAFREDLHPLLQQRTHRRGHRHPHPE